MLNVLLVGAGKMGGALAQRWQERRIFERLFIVEPGSTLTLTLSQKERGYCMSPFSLWEKVRMRVLPNPQSQAVIVKSSKDIPPGFKPQVIVFAVKPQALAEIAPDYKNFAAGGALILSIAAGKPASFFETHFGTNAKIIRSMPNLPAAIGKGITVAYANQNVSVTEKEWASTLLGAVGDVLWVEKENLLDPVTALSGSGPAYVFLLIETLAKAGVSVGLEPVMAEKLARQTVIGSAALADESPTISAANLRHNVTSPGGTTQAALDVLMAQPGIQDLFDRALKAAAGRAEELSR